MCVRVRRLSRRRLDLSAVVSGALMVSPHFSSPCKMEMDVTGAKPGGGRGKPSAPAGPRFAVASWCLEPTRRRRIRIWTTTNTCYCSRFFAFHSPVSRRIQSKRTAMPRASRVHRTVQQTTRPCLRAAPGAAQRRPQRPHRLTTPRPTPHQPRLRNQTRPRQERQALQRVNPTNPVCPLLNNRGPGRCTWPTVTPTGRPAFARPAQSCNLPISTSASKPELRSATVHAAKPRTSCATAPS